MSVSILSQPTGLIPSNGDVNFCFEFEIDNPALEPDGSNGFIAYRVLIDGCIVYEGTVLSSYLKGICDASPSLKYTLDISGIINNWHNLKTLPQQNATQIGINPNDLMFLQPNHSATVVVEYSEVVNGGFGFYFPAPAFRVMFAACGCEGDLRGIESLEDYDGDAGPDFKPLLVPSNPPSMSIYMGYAEKVTSGEWLHGGHPICFHVPVDWANIQFVFDVNGYSYTTGSFQGDLTNTTSQTVCIDTYVYLLLGWVLSGIAPEDMTSTIGEVYVRNGPGGDESEHYLVNLEMSTGCNHEIMYFLNCLGAYQPIHILREVSVGFEVSREQYVKCSTCGSGGGLTAKALKQQYNRVHTFYTEPMRTSASNIELLEAFITSAHHWFPRYELEVYIEPAKHLIELTDGRIQLAFDVYTAKTIPVLANS